MSYYKFVLTLFLLVFFCGVVMHGQTNKKFKGKKHTSRRELEKRKAEGEERNQKETPFSPVKKTSISKSEQRDDLFWKAQTGNTIYKHAGNISLYEASKYGIGDGLELQSYLPLNYWVPNVLIKKRWVNSDWKLASRHGIASATPGFKYAQSHQHYSIVDSLANIPFVLTLKNELLFSKPFIQKNSCTPNIPIWILNVGAGVDIGFLGDDELTEIEKPFLANRSAALTGNGYMAYLFVGGILPVNNTITADATLTYFHGSFSGSNALEQKLWVEFLLRRSFAASVGYKLSFANYSNTPTVGFLPMVDLTYYFGRKEGRAKGLFGKKMQ